ncbi:hypothetical protein AJ88_25420 [Mesorhizobium amorphae CCBAU 01583]|nr:hypothetical protein AJ88_25420 [Mesorhizobium amorphae CCBAU 01583]
MSAARAFLRPAMKRKNVRVETNALATRILFEGKRAVGVEYQQNGETRTARAGREVILSGGSVNSPQLLQLSGVGPSALLKGLGIPVVHANENVGANLQDHAASTTPSRAGCRRSTRSCGHGGASSWSACNTSCCAPARCPCR